MSGIIKGAARTALVLCVALSLGVAGCGGGKTGGGGGGGAKKDSRDDFRPQRKTAVVSEEEKAKLEEARKAAEAVERELSDLRLERMQLESGQ